MTASFRPGRGSGSRQGHRWCGGDGVRVQWWGAAPNEDVGTQVGTVLPRNGAALNSGIAELGRIRAKFLKDGPPRQCRDIPLDDGIVRESKAKAKSLQGLYRMDPEQAQRESPSSKWHDRPLSSPRYGQFGVSSLTIFSLIPGRRIPGSLHRQNPGRMPARSGRPAAA